MLSSVECVQSSNGSSHQHGVPRSIQTAVPEHLSLSHQLSLSVRACALLPKSAFRAYALLRKIAFRACRQEGISWGWPCSIGQVPANPLGPGGEGSHLRGETLLM